MRKNLKLKWPAAVAVALSLSAFSAGAFAQDHRNDDRGGHGRVEQHQDDHGYPGRGQPQAQVRNNYEFRDQDRQRLRVQYRSSLKTVRVANRPHFERGQRIPQSYRRYITPVPMSVRRGLPPPPRGYQVGYYQGYSVVYDPATYVILSVLDLLTP